MFPSTFWDVHSISRLDHMAMRDFHHRGWSLSHVTSRTPVPVADHSAHSTPCSKACDKRLLTNGANRNSDAYCDPIEDISVMAPL